MRMVKIVALLVVVAAVAPFAFGWMCDYCEESINNCENARTNFITKSKTGARTFCDYMCDSSYSSSSYSHNCESEEQPPSPPPPPPPPPPPETTSTTTPPPPPPPSTSTPPPPSPCVVPCVVTPPPPPSTSTPPPPSPCVVPCVVSPLPPATIPVPIYPSTATPTSLRYSTKSIEETSIPVR